MTSNHLESIVIRYVARSWALFALPALLLASCGGDPGGAPAEEASEEISADFSAVGGSAAEGAFRMTRDGDNFSAVVTIDTHRGPGDYPVHIHSGTCATGGSVAVPLESVEGGEGGEGQSRTTFPAADLPPGSYFVQLHDAQDQAAIACADLPAF